VAERQIFFVEWVAKPRIFFVDTRFASPVKPLDAPVSHPYKTRRAVAGG
jgi:hypothetical protein